MDYVFAGIPVSDLATALEWWERLLGRPPDMRPNETEACWQLTDSGWIYVVADEQRAGNGLLTVLVSDIDAEVAAVAGRGIDVGEIEQIPGARVTKITDPDGNRIQLGEPQAAASDARS
jgi:predicted enzyme related to lactoylglutathione lyase